MAKYLYDDFILGLSNKFSRKIAEIEVDHNFELGDEFEYAICEMLIDFLPSNFGVTRGFVVNKDGQKAGDDIIIYDRSRFPTLRTRGGRQFHRLENIPIEAVCAYIEAKNTITYDPNDRASTFYKAFEQASSVKKLVSEREPMNILSFNPYIKQLPFLGGGIKETQLLPSINNPAFSCILARNFKFKSDSSAEFGSIDLNFILENLKIPTQPVIPDLIVLGKDIILYPRIFDNGEFKEPILFNHNSMENLSYQVLVKENVAYGYFLCHLAFVLDWIRLGKMPWGQILHDLANSD